ncbi:hypothetical protein F442_14658, partial [Phytophthora nicotianae P10297]
MKKKQTQASHSANKPYSTQLETYHTVFQSAGVLGAVRSAMQHRPAPGNTASRPGTLERTGGDESTLEGACGRAVARRTSTQGTIVVKRLRNLEN